MDHPYKYQSNLAFWSRSVSSNYEPSKILDTDFQLLHPTEKIVSAGSCFASNIVPYLQAGGYHYIKTEIDLPAVATSDDNLGYSNFSAKYGFIYTARHLLQLYERALGIFVPHEEYWLQDEFYIDPYRPGLKFPSQTIQEFRQITEQHLRLTREAFESADVFVFTFGLTESWESSVDGAVFPVCPGTVAGEFDASKYVFRNFSTEDIVSDMNKFMQLLRQNNPSIRFILSVSPVPLVATATHHHVLPATIYSKSVLRVAAQTLAEKSSNVDYFPAYEIITGPQAAGQYFESDFRNVTKEGIEIVMSTLLGSKIALDRVKVAEISPRGANLIQLECDEAYLDSE